jgi:hypothetical protein
MFIDKKNCELRLGGGGVVWPVTTRTVTWPSCKEVFVSANMWLLAARGRNLVIMKLYFPGFNTQRRRDKTERGISKQSALSAFAGLASSVGKCCKFGLHSCIPVVTSYCIIILIICPVFYAGLFCASVFLGVLFFYYAPKFSLLSLHCNIRNYRV